MRAGITDGFGVPGEKNNGRRVIDFCVERNLSVILTLSIGGHKYTRCLETKMEQS